jgi:hypothetical protein
VSRSADGRTPGDDAAGWLPEADGELSRLIAAMCGGTATAADCDRLEVLLRDPLARRGYLAFMQVHGELLWRHAHGGTPAAGDPQPSATATSSPPTGRRPAASGDGGSRAAFADLGHRLRGLVRGMLTTLSRPAPLSILIAAVLVGGGLIVAGLMTLPPATGPAFEEIVGRITGLHEARWAGGGRLLGHWSPLAAGSRLELVNGLAEVSLSGGGRIIMQGPSVVEVLGSDRVAVARGLVAARYDKRARRPQSPEPAAIPLTIETPALVIEDLGTEFGVGVAADGSAEVHVFQGLVQLRPTVVAADAVPSRLGPGDARQVMRDGRALPVSVGFAARIVRTFPGREPPKPPPEWIASEAIVVYADPFQGSGPFTGTTPASRGGVGDAAWQAVGTTWSLADGLQHGPSARIVGTSVSLPFEPEPGWVYRVSATVDISAGGGSWGAVGFLSHSNRVFFSDLFSGGYAWMAQRHEHDPAYGANFAAGGPGITGKLEQTDDHFGRHRRMVQLDTRGRSWRAKFFVDGELVAWHVFDRPPPVRFVGLGAAGKATAAFTNFRVEAWRATGADSSK